MTLNKVININNQKYVTDLITWSFLLCERKYLLNWPTDQRTHIYLMIVHHPSPNRFHGHAIEYQDLHMGQMHRIEPHELFDFTSTQTVINSLVALHQDFLQKHNITVDRGSLLPADTIELPNDFMVAE